MSSIGGVRGIGGIYSSYSVTPVEDVGRVLSSTEEGREEGIGYLPVVVKGRSQDSVGVVGVDVRSSGSEEPWVSEMFDEMEKFKNAAMRMRARGR